MTANCYLLPALFYAMSFTAHGTGVFEALETTPQEITQSGIHFNIEALAMLPLSADERRDLLAGWLASTNPRRALLASQWLEFCGQPDAALSILKDAPDDKPDLLQLTRLLYRNGQHEAAAAAFAKSQQDLPCGPFSAYAPPKLELLLRPLVACSQWDETARFLAWLQPRCTISEWRSSVLSTRIDLALQQGVVNELLDSLAKEAPLTRRIADKFFDLGAGTMLAAPAPGTAVADIAWCLEVDDCTPELAPSIESAINSGAGNPAERRELFRQLARFLRSTPDRQRLLVLWMAREEEFIGHFTALSSWGIGQLPVLPLCELAARNPQNPYLNYLAGCNNNEYSHGKIIGPARACLWRALDHGNLVARPLDPTQDPFFPLDDYYRHSAVTDPARFALSALSERADPEILYQHLTAHSEFAKLPVIDQFRYLLAADLEMPAWGILRQIDWSQPANDSLGGALRLLMIKDFHFRQPSTGTLAEMFKLLPKMLLGSPTKSASQIAAQSDMVFRYLGPPGEPQKNIFYDVWIQGVRSRGVEFTHEVFQGCPWLLSEDEKAAALRTHLDISATDPPVRAAAQRRVLEIRLGALNWFRGPGISGFPVGYGLDDGNRFVGEDAGRGWFFQQPGRDKELFWLSHRYPGLRQVLDSSLGFMPESSQIHQLRGLLPLESPQAIALDLAIHRRLVKAPPEAGDRSAKHIDGLLATRKEPDFVLYRASDGVAMRHGDRPRNSDSLLELSLLSGAPPTVRRAAADLLSMGESYFPKERISELQAVKIALDVGVPRPHSVLRRAVQDALPRKEMEDWRDPTRIAENLARARKYLSECPDDEDAVDLLARSLGRNGDLEELRNALKLLYKLDTGKFIFVLSQPEILTRFAKPGLPDITAFFSMPPSSMLPGQLPNSFPTHLLRSIHNTLFKQDPAMAASFRRLLPQHHWFPFLTEDLVRAGHQSEAVDWLASCLTAPPLGPRAFSALRFASQSKEKPEAMGPDVLLHDLDVFTIIENYLAPSLIAALSVSKDPARQLAIAYLKVLDNPTIEIYRQAFEPAIAGQDAAASSDLKKRFIAWLKRHKSTQALAAVIAADPL